MTEYQTDNAARQRYRAILAEILRPCQLAQDELPVF